MKWPEMDMVLEWAAREGWNPGLHDAEAFYHADPSGYFVGLLSGIPVASISSVAYDGRFGFLGLYIVRPEYRGKGLGIKIWEKALEYLGNRSVGLDGVVARQKDYEKYDFRFAYRNLRFVGNLSAFVKPSKNVTDLKNVDVRKIIEYDSKMFPARRDNFLSKWISQEGSRALGYLSDNGRLAGYGVARPCVTGFKVGPLFADNEQVAKELLSELAGRAARGGENPAFFIDVPEPNQHALDLAKRIGMKKVFETARMYNKAAPVLPLDRIYGVTSLELG